jgi:periplasmic protein CpxP/Spy
MKLNKRTIFAVVLGLVMAALPGIAQNVQPVHMHGHGWGDGMPFFSDALDLTDAQRTQIKQIFHSGHAAMKPLMEQEHQSHQAMIQLITSGTFEQAKAQTIANQEAQVHAQMSVLHAQAASQAYQVLTADQKTKFNELLAQHQQRMQERMQQHQQNGQAPQTQQ